MYLVLSVTPKRGGLLRQLCGHSNIFETQTLPRKESNVILEAALINGVGVSLLNRLMGVSSGITQRINEKSRSENRPLTHRYLSSRSFLYVSYHHFQNQKTQNNLCRIVLLCHVGVRILRDCHRLSCPSCDMCQ